MSKITIVGNGFIQIGNILINLKQYKEIEKYTFGYDEDPEGSTAFGIRVSPLSPSKEDVDNGVDGSSFIVTYGEDEDITFEDDFKKIKDALKNSAQ